MFSFPSYLFAFLLSFLFYTFFGDDIKRYWRQSRERADELSTADKIAKVKELSDNPKDIEKFIMDNAAKLSAKAVDRLIARLDTLKDDRVIMDDNLKKRIADITPVEDDEIPHSDFGRAMVRARGKKGS